MDVITVGGPPGSGTSTVCRLLKDRTGMKYIYAGQIFREQAREIGLTLSEFGALCEDDPLFDRELDERMLKEARSGNVILEGRMIGPLCFSEHIVSLKVYIDADPEVRVKRVTERDGGVHDDVVLHMINREKSEAQRYLQFYDMDPRDKKWYDLTIDSSLLTPDDELNLIMQELNSGV